MMKAYIRKAGVKKVVSPVHSFRHSVATHLLEGGMDVRYVQVLLGHNNINSTQIYTHVERATLQGLLRKFHPRELAREKVQAFVEEEKKAYVKA
jgi:integrase/recombinase XerD